MSKKKAKSPVAALCPCGSGAAYEACCGRWHGGDPAPTPEALMRSRYSAYALKLDDYVKATWAPETRPSPLFEAGEPRPKWLSLTILSSSEEGDAGEVEFIAKGKTAHGAFKLQEKSRFRRENGRWLYVDGTFKDE